MALVPPHTRLIELYQPLMDCLGRFAVVSVIGQYPFLQAGINGRVPLVVLKPRNGLCSAWILVGVLETNVFGDFLQPITESWKNYPTSDLAIEVDHLAHELIERREIL